MRVVQSGGTTFVNINTSGVATGEAQIEIAGLVTLTAADFVL